MLWMFILGLFYISVIFVQGIVEMHSFLVNNNILLHLVFEFFLKSTKTIRSLLILNANSISTKNIQITIHMIILFFKIITEKKKLNSSIISSIFNNSIHTHTHTGEILKQQITVATCTMGRVVKLLCISATSI